MISKISIDNLTINHRASILEAMVKLNNILFVGSISKLILFVTDESSKVVGTLTDGDIRRSIINSKSLEGQILDLCNRGFTYLKDTNSFIELEQYRKRGIKILPILSDSGQLVKVIDLEKTKSILPIECMIMAGGRGKRLSPLTDSVPKPMLPLGDKPIIEHNIDRLIEYGIKKIYISVKYLGEQIESYFGDGSSKGIQIEYIWEDEPLGTAGALSLVDKFNSNHILLMNSDLFTDVNFEQMFLDLLENDADMVIASTEYKIDIPFAILQENNSKVSEIKEKPTYKYHSNAGVYIFKKEVISKISKGNYCDITDVIESLLVENGSIVHSPIKGFWIDIGKPEDYDNAKDFIKHLQ